jgi:hypothetical protein
MNGLAAVAARFNLPWSHYVRMLSVRNPEARRFYEQEALSGGWTIKQLDRQIGSQFYERTALSRNKTAMLRKGLTMTPTDVVTPDEELKDPYVLEFLNLKDEYSEIELEAPSSRSSRPSWSSSEETSRSSDGSGVCASATSGIGSTSCSSTAGSGAWSSST